MQGMSAPTERGKQSTPGEKICVGMTTVGAHECEVGNVTWHAGKDKLRREKTKSNANDRMTYVSAIHASVAVRPRLDSDGVNHTSWSESSTTSKSASEMARRAIGSILACVDAFAEPGPAGNNTL